MPFGLGFSVCGKAPCRNAAPGAHLLEAAKSRVAYTIAPCFSNCSMLKTRLGSGIPKFFNICPTAFPGSLICKKV
jgi:hypothetical protein